jgi:hypothetical protein
MANPEPRRSILGNESSVTQLLGLLGRMVQIESSFPILSRFQRKDGEPHESKAPP